MALIVAFEGIRGAGKSVAIHLLTLELRHLGLRAVRIGSETHPDARPLLQAAAAYSFAEYPRIVLMWAVRVMQYKAIQECFDDYDVVFADRCWITALVTDGYGHRMPLDLLDRIGQALLPAPDLVFHLDVDGDIANRRKEKAKSAAGSGLATARDLYFDRLVQDGYRTVAVKRPWVSIDASASEQVVVEQCLDVILRRLRG